MRQMTVFQKIRYVYVRVGMTLFILMPVAMWLMFRPWGVPAGTLVSDDTVTVVDREDAVVFRPVQASGAGVMLLPGCPVDPHAYAPLARRLAAAGHPALVVRVQYRCASFGDLEAQLDRRVRDLLAEFENTRWLIAGHSRGAMHAARIAQSMPESVAGLVLMGTSHPRERDLSGLRMPVMKIAATNDGVAGEGQFDSRRLPPSTAWVRIDGGNHAQFGYYAPYQLFDGRATISRIRQQDEIAVGLAAALARAR